MDRDPPALVVAHQQQGLLAAHEDRAVPEKMHSHDRGIRLAMPRAFDHGSGVGAALRHDRCVYERLQQSVREEQNESSHATLEAGADVLLG